MDEGFNDNVLIVKVFKDLKPQTVAVYIGCAIRVRIALRIPKFCIETWPVFL